MNGLARMPIVGVLLLFSSCAWAQFDFHQTDELCDKFEKDLGGDLVALVYKSGNIIFQKELGVYVADRQTPIGSASKWLTCALVMTFVEEGKLSLQDSIGKFLPVFTSYGKGAVSLGECLNETSGFEQDPPNALSLNQIRENSKHEKMHSLEEQVNDYALSKPLVAGPGLEFRYGGIGLDIAARILEVVSGQGFESLFQKRMALPLGMTSTSFSKDKGPVNPSSGAYTSASDYLHFLIMILNKGVYHGKRVLSAASVLEMEKSPANHTTLKYAPKALEGFGYGLGLWILDRDKQGQAAALTCPGQSGAWPMVDNCRQYACIFLVKSSLSEKQRDMILQLKRSLDQQIRSTCP
jgi:CubicO group peptidase (beta-lactamase class C family)